MKSRVLTIVVALTSAAAAAVIAAEPEFSADRIRAHVSFLADDLLEGREAGTRGHEIAASYVASQFALLGVKPGGQNGGYFFKVDLLESSLTGAAPTLALTTGRGTQTLKHRGNVFVKGPIAGAAVNLSAPLVFVGFGMKDAAVGYDDYKGLDVRGKIAVVLYGSPKGIDSEVGAHLQSEQARVAAEHGAVAIISVMTHTTARAFPWQQVLVLLRDESSTWVRRDGMPFDPSYGLKASAIIEPAVADALFVGASKTLNQILDEADQTGGRPQGFELKATGTIAVATKVRRFSSPNVVGIIEGSDPKLKNEYVVLMGHVDHIGVKKDGTGDRINNGALDNAAGTATLIEVARALAVAPDRPRRSVLIVANTAEEKGLLGAESFAHAPTVPIDRMIAAIDLDMPMLLYDFTDVVAYGSTHSTLKGVFEKTASAMGIKLSPDPMPEQAVFVRSDHYTMVKQGVPAVMLATGMANGGDKAWAT
ncbi:MAG TPA: M28 family peptidase [Vicinamibacterales bacterium]|nr:M28 family peptidase [Vicinamibacterales bacterium]